MNTNRSDASFWPDDGIILYDGVCVLCSGWMRFVLRRDRDGLFRFTPIQSDYGSALARALGIDPVDPDTNAGYVLMRVEQYEKIKSMTDTSDVESMYPLLAEIEPDDWEDVSHYEKSQ